MQSHRTDIELLAAAKLEIPKGDDTAFEQILYRYERLIHHVARRYFPDTEDALDACQEVAIKIYNGLQSVTLSEDGNLKAWLCTVTARVCLDGVRKRRVVTTELDETIATSTTPSAEESAFANERVREITQAINKLPNDHRIILILRDMQGLSYEELAESLDISVGTVKSRLSRARAALVKKLK
jgi:RNA polymerase sigma-70 factor (ECF subfamily)